MSYKVLVIDDEAPVRELFGELLARDHYTVKCVTSGEEALCIIEGEEFDVVLLDIKLTGMSGLEALKKIKDKKPQVAVIMMTGFGYDDDLISRCRESGCAGYIGKNMPISQIISSFKLFIASAKERNK